MPKKYLKNSVIILGLLALLAANFAYAESLGDQTRNQSGFIYSLAHAAGKAVYLAGQVTTWALNLNSRIIKGNPTLTAGWTISRDLANLGFVLVIIVIAFATILRIETYGMKQILWKLIIAALLINFSLVIAGVFIDFAGVVTNFFLLQSVDSPNKVAQVLADGLALQQFVGKPPRLETDNWVLGALGSLLSFGPALLEISTTLIFILAFTIIGFLTMAVFAGMLFIRYIVLSILLILMPLVWLFWIIPDLSGYWKQWWNEFFKWTFFAPAVSFFVFLAINAKSSNIGGEIMTSSIGYASVGTLLDGFGRAIGQLFMTMGLLVGGMMAAQSMGIAGASVVTNAAAGIKDQIVGAPGSVVRGARGLAGAGARGLGRFAMERAATFGADEAAGKKSWVQRAANWAAGKPLVGTAIAGTLNEFAQTAKKKVDEHESDMKTWTPEMILNRANASDAFISESRTAALANKMATTKIRVPKKDKDGKEEKDAQGNVIMEEKYIIDALDKGRLEKFLDTSRKLGTTDKLLGTRPDFADKLGSIELGKSIEAVVEKASARTVEGYSPEALEKGRVAGSLGLNHYERLAKEGSKAQKAAVIKGLLEALQFAEKIQDTDERERQMQAILPKRDVVFGNIAFQEHIPEDVLEDWQKVQKEIKEKKEASEAGMSDEDKRFKDKKIGFQIPNQ